MHTLSLALLIALLISCPFYSISQAKLRIDTDAALSGTVSEYVDSVLFIPLERSKESECSNIYQFEIAEEHFIILDKEKNAVLIFTKSGKPHAKIPVDKNVHQIFLNRKENHVEVIKGLETLIYDMNGKLIKTVLQAQKPNTMLGVTRMPLGNRYTAFYNTSIRTTKDSLVHQILIYENDRIVQSFLPFPSQYKFEVFDNFGSANFSRQFNGADTSVFYFTNYDYTVYQLTPTSFTPIYRFFFPMEKSLPAGFGTDSSYNGKRTAFLRDKKNRPLILRLYRFYKMNDALFFSDGRFSYMLNPATQRFVCTSKLTGDAASYFLPINETGADSNEKSVYLNTDGHYIYFLCSAAAFCNQMEASKDRKIKYPPALEKFFNDPKNKTEGNPILVQLKFKDSF